MEKIGAGSTATHDGQAWSAESWDPVGRDENLWVLGQRLREEGAVSSDPAAAGTGTASTLGTDEQCRPSAQPSVVQKPRPCQPFWVNLSVQDWLLPI